MHAGAPVRCRPHPSLWLAVLLSGGVGVVFLAAPAFTSEPVKPGERALFLLCGLAFLLPALAAGWWMLRATVLADETGLRWRIWRRWRSARWHEVTDYYDLMRPKGPPQTVIVIGSERLKLARDWTRVKALRALVESRATQAHARSWGFFGTRPEDAWPCVFSYDTPDNRRTPYLLSGSALCIFGLCAWFIGVKAGRILSEMGPGIGLAAIGFGVVVILLHLLLLLPAAAVLRDARRRRRERITVDTQQIAFEDGERRVAALWTDVTGYTVAGRDRIATPARYIVTTRQGSFDFTFLIREPRRLMATIARFAPQPDGTGWRSEEEESLDRRSGEEREAGERLYTYRNRTNRALLWLSCAPAGAVWLGFLLARLGWTAPQDTTATVTLATVFSLFAAWCVWRYRTAAVRIEERGITQYGPFRFVHIPWTEVKNYSLVGEDAFTRGQVVGTSARIWFWIFINDRQSLMSEISHRAVNSLSKTWERT